jgi:hypothetical protein
MAKFHWIPAVQEYHCICIYCGENLNITPESITFLADGDCNPPETLGINVKESVGVKDRFGGAGG